MLEQAIEGFSARAPELQLSELLDAIRRRYEDQVSILDQTIDLLGKKKQHPQTFEAEINRIQDLLRDYHLLMNEFSERVVSDYTGLGASFQHELDQLKSSHQSQIRDAPSNDAVKKSLADFHDANCAFVDRIADRIRQTFEAELHQRGVEFREKHSITITIPRVDIAGIEGNAKDEAYIEMEVPREAEGFWELTLKVISLGLKEYTKRETVLDQKKFLAEFKRLADARVVELIDKDSHLIGAFVQKFASRFRRSMSTLIDHRQQALEEIKRRKEDNDEILWRIEGAQKKKEIMCWELVRVREMLEDLR